MRNILCVSSKLCGLVELVEWVFGDVRYGRPNANVRDLGVHGGHGHVVSVCGSFYTIAGVHGDTCVCG